MLIMKNTNVDTAYKSAFKALTLSAIGRAKSLQPRDMASLPPRHRSAARIKGLSMALGHVFQVNYLWKWLREGQDYHLVEGLAETKQL